MTNPAFFAIPGDLAAPTGGYEYARKVLHALPNLTYLPLPGSFPHPTIADLTAVAERLGAIPADAVVLVDGLALGALPAWCLDRVRAPVVALVHHPLFLETGLPAADRVAFRTSEHAALNRSAHVITTSASTASLLTDLFAVPRVRITIAEPGTKPAARARGGGGIPRLLAVGAVVPRKAYDLLLEALAGITDQPWTLTIAGALDRDVAEVVRLRQAVADLGLGNRVTLAGAVDAAALDALYAAADLFVIASRHEGYGMAAAEAMVRGLPLVASTAGALAATIPDAAGLRVAPGSAVALRTALQRMLRDQALRARCAEASWAAGLRLPRWPDTAARVAAALAACRSISGMPARSSPQPL